MNWKRTARWSLLILPFLLLALWPGLAAAQSGVATGTNALLYEVTENLKLLKGDGISTAALMGTVNAGTPICPDRLAAFLRVTACDITATASRDISLSTGTGQVTGTFQVVINTSDTNLTDGSELVVVEGSLSGQIDLSLALLGVAPRGSISGQWSAKGVKGGPWAGVHAQGTFTGTFRLPFQLPFSVGPLSAGTVLYAGDTFLSPSNLGDVFPANPATEFSLGVPTVRLEVKFE